MKGSDFRSGGGLRVFLIATTGRTELLGTDPLWVKEKVYYTLKMQKGCPEVHCPLLMLRLGLTYTVIG